MSALTGQQSRSVPIDWNNLDNSLNTFSDKPQVATLTTPDGLVCPACSCLELGKKFDRPKSVQVQHINSVQFAMSMHALNGTHPCKTLCDIIEASTAADWTEPSDGAAHLTVKDVTCCAQLDRQQGPSAVTPMLSQSGEDTLYFVFLLINADGIEVHTLRGFQLETTVVEHIIIAGIPLADAVGYLDIMGFAFKRRIGVYHLFSKELQEFLVEKPMWSEVLSLGKNEEWEQIQLLFPMRLKLKMRFVGVFVQTSGYLHLHIRAHMHEHIHARMYSHKCAVWAGSDPIFLIFI